jgi:ankyrin repeat protein
VDGPSQKYFNACSTGKASAVAEFLETGVSPDARDAHGLTGVIWAGRKGRVEVADLLLAKGAAIDAVDRRGRTAVYHAVTYTRYEFVQHAVRLGANVNPVDMHGWTPRDFAEASGDRKMVVLLAELGGTSSRARS